MPAKTPRARLAAGLLLLGLAALPACRSTSGGGFITLPRAGTGSPSDAGPELEPLERGEPGAQTAAAPAGSAGRGGGGAADKAGDSEPLESAAASVPERPGFRDPASAAASDQEAGETAAKGSFAAHRSSGAARGRPSDGSASRSEERSHSPPSGPEGGAPEGGRSRSERDKKPDIPVQDLTRRPFRLRQKPAGAGVPAAALPMDSNLADGVPAAAPDSETPPPLTQLDADMSGSLELETMLVGAYLIQISTSPDFARLLFSKVYDFMEDQDAFGDIAALELRKGYYWVRYAFLDLLGGQHPFSRPRSYAYRPPEKKLAEPPRKRKS
jgi:hypothetical protein